MKINRLFFTLLAAAVAVSCKTDKESDLQPLPSDIEGVYINEVYASNPDWIEIYNASDEEVDISGFILQDEKGAEEEYVIPAGTIIPANSYVIFEEGEFTFGLSSSNGDTVTLLDADGNTVDTVTFPVMENNTSYGRETDGADNWCVFTVPTKGAANMQGAEQPEQPDPETPQPDAVKDYSGLVLNELNGNKPKYIELYNSLEQAVDLEGVQLRKNDETPVIWIAPAGMTIPAGGRVTLLADQATNNTAVGFQGGLSAKKSVKIELLDPAGTLIDVFKNLTPDGEEIWDVEPPKYNGDTDGLSFGRYPDGAADWFMMQPSNDAPNTEGGEAISMEVSDPSVEPEPEVSYEGLVLNELDGNEKYIELYNGSDTDMDITGVQIYKDDEDVVYIAPEGTVVKAGGFLLLYGNQDSYENGFTSGLSADKSVKIVLRTPDGSEEIDVFKNLSVSQGEVWGEDDGKYDGKSNDNSFARYPDGVGAWYVSEPTAGSANVMGGEEIVW